MGTIANVLVGTGVLSLKVPFDGSWVATGYALDGLTMAYAPTTQDIRVDEESVAIDRALMSEEITFTCNIPEASLANLEGSIAGASLSGSVLTIGGGTLLYIALKFVGTNPAGNARTIEVFKGTATGTVGIPFKKGEINYVPFEFKALKASGQDVCTITDA